MRPRATTHTHFVRPLLTLIPFIFYNIWILARFMDARREGKHNEEADRRVPCTLSQFMAVLVAAADELLAAYGGRPPD